MRFRKLRIAWSVGWGAIALLFVVLWMRSYWRSDSISAKVGNYRWDVCSSRGTIGSLVGIDEEPDEDGFIHHYITAADRAPLLWWYTMLDEANHGVDYVVLDDDVKYLVVRCWVPPVFAAFAAALPWLRFHFSLRTLLIATTLIAVVLGLIVWR